MDREGQPTRALGVSSPLGVGGYMVSVLPPAASVSSRNRMGGEICVHFVYGYCILGDELKVQVVRLANARNSTRHLVGDVENAVEVERLLKEIDRNMVLEVHDVQYDENDQELMFVCLKSRTKNCSPRSKLPKEKDQFDTEFTKLDFPSNEASDKEEIENAVQGLGLQLGGLDPSWFCLLRYDVTAWDSEV